MAFIKTIADQVTLSFTGRVNVLEKTSGKYLGKVSLLDGMIVFSSYKGNTGKSSLFHIVIDDLEHDSLSFVVEPEIVTLSEAIFEITYEDFVKDGQNIYQAYLSAKKYRPPDHIRLLIDPDFIARGPNISFWEFEVLTVISDFNKVSDIFKESDLLEYQICNSLVSLRKKAAIKVLA
ncbi:MAG: hypothetical protein K9K67_02000 [Bacteriovoracaceae bacterium]|nr:hypothetical protein [Bacteriovoracaceae bacterium]